MKIIFTVICCLCWVLTLPGQTGQTAFFKTTRKNNVLIIEVTAEAALVYQMGTYYTKAGISATITKTDTLHRQSAGIYQNEHYLLNISANVSFRLRSTNKEITIVPYDYLLAWQTLNNAYLLEKYFALSKTLNKQFPRYHYSFRNGYDAWEKNDKKNLQHSLFRQITDARISFISDSIVTIQQQLVSCSNFIFQHADKSDYATLRDSLQKLPIEYTSNSAYFSDAVLAITKSNPEYFFRIVADFPADKRSIIYSSVQYNRGVVKQLKLIQGHDDAKKAFLRSYRSDRLMAYKITGMYLILGGLIALLISK